MMLVPSKSFSFAAIATGRLLTAFNLGLGMGLRALRISGTDSFLFLENFQDWLCCYINVKQVPSHCPWPRQ